MRDLLIEERVILFRGEWIDPDHEREAVTDPDAALRNWATWALPPGEPVVWMADA